MQQAQSGAVGADRGERRVAGMAATGMTNRVIAQALFVSTSTVETHLRHAYQKLGIGGRHSLTQSLLGSAESAFSD